MPTNELKQKLKTKMEAALGSLDHNLNGLRTGRASTNIFDGIFAEVYGNKMPISQLASITAPESRLISIQVWDRESVKPIEKAIATSNLGVSPISEGQTIRINLPLLSEERRKELSKVAQDFGEQAKVVIRNIRRDGMDDVKKLEKSKTISEDELHRMNDDIQKVTDEFIKKVDVHVLAKQQEISKV
jgi:ribosome recycling factor